MKKGILLFNFLILICFLVQSFSFFNVDPCYEEWLNSYDNATQDYQDGLDGCDMFYGGTSFYTTCVNGINGMYDLSLWNAGNTYITCIENQ